MIYIYNFVFDLDDTVVSSISYDKEAKLSELQEQLGFDFINNFSVEVLGYPHLIFPGYNALFRWLFDNGHNLYFFSNAIKERNEDLVPKFMKKFFPQDYQNILNRVKIFSRGDCIDTTKIWDQEEKNKYQSYHYGQCKKKLEGIVVEEKELPNTLLIEDDYSYMTCGEEYNLVMVSSGIGFYPYHKDSEAFQEFHKAYYLCGLFQTMFECISKENFTLVEAAKYVQIDLEGKELNRDFYYPSRGKMDYYKKGLQILKTIDTNLDFYFLPQED